MTTFVCGIFYLFGSVLLFGNNVDATSCYFMAPVNADSIHFETSTKKVIPKIRGDPVTYDLQLQTSWDRPEGSHFSDFEVLLSLPSNLSILPTCTAKDGGHLTNNKTFFVFHNLLHGYNYDFRVRGYEAHVELYAFLVVSKSFVSPDCFQETKDADYCSERSILTIGAPTFLRLHAVSAIDDAKARDVTAILRWSKPIQINGTLNIFVLIYNVQGAGTAAVTTDRLTEAQLDVLGNETTGVIYEYTIPGLINKETYDFKVRPFCYKEGASHPGADISISAVMNVTIVHLTTNEQSGRNIGPLFAIAGTEPSNAESPITEAESKVTTTSNRLTWQIWSAISGASLMVFITATCCLRATIRKRKAAHRSDELLSDIKSQSIHRISGGKIEEVSGVPDIVFKNRELDRSLLQLDRELGSGQFGVVYKAYAFGVDGSNEFVPVAVKCLKENADFAMKEDFLDEIRLLIEIDSHPNILSVLGCCTIEEPCYLITEYMRYGDLLRFLWKSREERYRIQDAVYNITQENRLQIARQIARGMEYLSKTRYYHGDLAARNILVGENLVVKISDFGLADDIYQAGYKRLSPDKKRPVKWVSLETNTTGKCTIQSDVWSYGIVLYEIYTSGGVPYPGMSGRELIQKLQDGYRLESPEECPDELYEVMMSCWQVNPSDRPTFNTLYRIMDCLLAEQSDYLATEEERSARILPLIKTTSLSSGSVPDKDVPLVPERPRETLGEEEGGEEGEGREMVDEGEKQDISVESGKSKVQELTPNGSQDMMIGHVNEAYDPDVEGSGGGSSLETFLEEDDRITNFK